MPFLPPNQQRQSTEGQFISIIILAEKSAPAKNFHFFTKWSKKYITCTSRLQLTLQCFDAVGWVAGRASGL